jgi:hypothetical protein
MPRITASYHESIDAKPGEAIVPASIDSITMNLTVRLARGVDTRAETTKWWLMSIAQEKLAAGASLTVKDSEGFICPWLSFTQPSEVDDIGSLFKNTCANCGEHLHDHKWAGGRGVRGDVNHCPGDRPYPEIADEPGDARRRSLESLTSYWLERGTSFEPLSEL